MLLYLQVKTRHQKNGLCCYSFDDFINLGTKTNPQVYGYTTEEHEHHQTGPHGPQERIIA